MLDDLTVLQKRDSENTIETTALQYMQTTQAVEIVNPGVGSAAIKNIVAAGMGGSGLAAQVVQTWLGEDLKVPFEAIRDYKVPGYVDSSSLVIVSSCSGNTEEAISSLEDARARGAQLVIIAGGGKLLELASEYNLPHVVLINEQKVQPRMLTFLQLKAMTSILAAFGLVSELRIAEIAETSQWLADESQKWKPEVPTNENHAKQLALQAVGKTPVFYGGELTWSLAYKWKISWNENSKNVAFYNRYPEVSHNEFMGWTSHPVEKPFVVFDLISNLEHSQIKKRFEVSDRLLSGMRPKAITVELAGDTILKQLFWGNVLADYASIYAGLLNNVDPGPVPLITKLKQELA